MAEESITLEVADLELEALWEDRPGERAVVVTHPHPLYGGDMHNNVVAAILEAYRGAGIATLRFNFRGAGLSGGAYDQGDGEQADVQAALDFVAARGKRRVDLAGYSFGAWVSARGLPGYRIVERLLMVSPPVNFMDFDFLAYSPKIQLVIAASEDEIGPPAMIEPLLPKWNPGVAYHVIAGADHFYGGRAGEITALIRAFLTRTADGD